MYTPLLYTLIACAIVMLASLSGVFFTSQKLSGWMDRHLKYLISFSAGVFLVIFFNLTQETFEHTENIWITLTYLLVGFSALSIISAFIPEYHHHHTQGSDHSHSMKSAHRVIIGDSIHNIGDGIVLAIAFSVNPFVGLVATAGILIHETVQEVSEFFVLKDAGMTIREALVRNVISSATILIGALIGFFIADTEAVTALILGISAGAFLYISSKDLLPKVIRHALEERSYIRYIQFAVLGMAVIVALNYFIGHAHEEDRVDEQIHLSKVESRS
jgi:zinc and cadmium transporter